MLYTLTADLGDAHADPALHEEFERAWTEILTNIRQFKLEADQKYLGLSGLRTSPQPHGSTWFAEYHGEARLGERRLLVALEHVEVAGYTVEKTRDGHTIKQGDQIAGFIVKLAPDPVVVQNAQRQVFSPTLRPEKQYVKDDIGNLTRRFAFCVRPGEDGPETKRRPVRKSELVEKNKNAIRGNSVDRNRAAELAATADGRDSWHTENQTVKLFLGYMNYASDGKLGYCLASTPLRIRDNPGVAFADKAGYSLWIIDLAMVPTSCVLVNLYAQYPSLALTAKTNRRTYNQSAAWEWISSGTAKNREAFCSDLPYACIVKEILLTREMVENNYNWKAELAITSAIDKWREETG